MFAAPRVRFPVPVLESPALPEMMESMVPSAVALIAGVTPSRLIEPPWSVYPAVVKVMLLAVTPAPEMLTIPAVPPKNASSLPELVNGQIKLVPALARLSQLVLTPESQVPAPPSGLAPMSFPSQKKSAEKSGY